MLLTVLTPSVPPLLPLSGAQGSAEDKQALLYATAPRQQTLVSICCPPAQVQDSRPRSSCHALP